MKRLALFSAGFAGMEAASYVTHRWLMHSPRGMSWHRSHHPPAEHGFEKNDLYPATFASAAVVAFALAAVKPRFVALRWLGLGVTAYGACYAAVHEGLIHQRVPLPRAQGSTTQEPTTRRPSVASRYLNWLESSHRIHHLYGGEPYGMLLPVVQRELRTRAATSNRDPWRRRSSNDVSRARL